MFQRQLETQTEERKWLTDLQMRQIEDQKEERRQQFELQRQQIENQKEERRQQFELQRQQIEDQKEERRQQFEFQREERRQQFELQRQQLEVLRPSPRRRATPQPERRPTPPTGSDSVPNPAEHNDAPVTSSTPRRVQSTTTPFAQFLTKMYTDKSRHFITASDMKHEYNVFATAKNYPLIVTRSNLLTNVNSHSLRLHPTKSGNKIIGWTWL